MEENRNYGTAIDGGARYPQPDMVMGPRQQIAGNAEVQAPTMPPQNIARGIQIQPINHGFLVKINCQEFAVESKEALLHRLGLYLSDPNKVEQDWMSGKIKW